MSWIKPKNEVDDLFDKLLEQLSELHDEWEVDKVRRIREQYDRVYNAWEKHESKFNG